MKGSVKSVRDAMSTEDDLCCLRVNLSSAIDTENAVVDYGWYSNMLNC